MLIITMHTVSGSTYTFVGTMCHVNRTYGHPLGEREDLTVNGWRRHGQSIIVHVHGGPDVHTSPITRIDRYDTTTGEVRSSVPVPVYAGAAA